MPPPRSLEVAEEFDDVERHPSHLQCIPCSREARREILVDKGSVSRHRKSKKHLSASVKHGGRSRLVDVPQTQYPASEREPALLTVSGEFLTSNIDSHPEALSAQPPSPIFHNVIAYDDEFIDGNGDTIMLADGGETYAQRVRNELARQMDSLQDEQHTIFAPNKRTLLEEFDDRGDDATVSAAVAALDAACLEDADEDETEEVEEEIDADASWAPHGSKAMFFLDLLDNLPRLRLSDDQLKAIIWVMKECGVNVPSFSALRKKQAKLTENAGIKSELFVSALGNHFFANRPPALFGLDWANPLVRGFIHPYPDITSCISESWQAGKWVEEVPREDLSPMWADWVNAPYRHFFIDELAALKNGDFVMPLRWITVEGKDHFDCHVLRFDNASRCFELWDRAVIRKPASELLYNVYDLQHQFGKIEFSDNAAEWNDKVLNPLRDIAKGRPMFTIRLMCWGDDVSGNRSKQYNPHTNIYLANASLPHKKLLQEYFVRFSSTSQHASVPELLAASFKDMKSDVWHVAFDCDLKSEILFRILGHATPGDNPQQAQNASVVGSQGKHNCRYGVLGGTAEDRETKDGFHAHFFPCDSRTPENTKAEIRKQYETACLGVKDAVDVLQSSTGVKDVYAEFWIPELLTMARERQWAKIHKDSTSRDARLSDRKVATADKELIRQEIKLSIQADLMDWLGQQGLDSEPPPSQDNNAAGIIGTTESSNNSDGQCQPSQDNNNAAGIIGMTGSSDNSDGQRQPSQGRHTAGPMDTEESSDNSDGQRRRTVTLRPGVHFNPLLEVDGLNPHKDNPTEILHTALIGVDKYIWYDSTKAWKKEQDDEFATRLESSSLDGLNLPAIRGKYITQYKNSLIGKHFKALQQLAVFHMQDNLCSPAILQLWKSMGEFGALLWYHEIKDMATYLADLQVLIDNLLDAWAEYDPRRILVKMKLHVLAHLPDDVRRHGPAVLYSTEVFECWNAIFRMCSVLSNHLAPSRDIAQTLAGMERFKHQVSGGWWKNHAGEWVQAGPKVRSFMKGNNELQRRLGWVDDVTLKPGSVRHLAKKKQSTVRLLSANSTPDSGSADKDDRAIVRVQEPNSQYADALNTHWLLCKGIVSRSHEICFPGSWIFFRDANSPLYDASPDHILLAGRISHILVPPTSGNQPNDHPGAAAVIIERFEISNTNDTRTNMPILSRMLPTYPVMVRPKDVLFKFNAQHDCFNGKCAVEVGRQMRTQERQPVERSVQYVAHSNDSRYLLNTHALHNAARIREVLPRHLVAPTPYFADRRAKHDEIAEHLQATGPIKRQEAKDKAQATRQKRKREEAEAEEHARNSSGKQADNL